MWSHRRPDGGAYVIRVLLWYDAGSMIGYLGLCACDPSSNAISTKTIMSFVVHTVRVYRLE